MLPTKSGANLGGYSLGSLKGEDETIEIIPLDEMIDTLKPVALLKVDVEGWERDVPIRSREVIARDRPMLYVENDRAGKSRDLVISIMEMNYVWWHIVPFGLTITAIRL